MKLLFLGLTLVLTSLAVIGCGPSAETTFDNLQHEFIAKHRDFIMSPGTTSQQVEQWKQAEKKCVDGEAYAARFLALAKAHPKTDVAKRSLWSVISYCSDTPSCTEAVAILGRDYSEEFPVQCQALAQSRLPYADQYLRAITEKSPSREMQARAMLGRARFRQAAMHDTATSETLLEQIVAQYPDITVRGRTSLTLAEIARDDLVNLHDPNLAPRPLRAGQKAFPFETQTTDGRTIKFPDAYKGKVVLLDFWATWCLPCVQEIPNVVDTYEKFHSHGLEVLSVSLDQEHSAETLAKFVEKHKMSWPQIYDGKYVDSAVARRYGITGIPHAIVVDGDTGLIVADGPDARGHKLAPAIEAALAARKVAAK